MEKYKQYAATVKTVQLVAGQAAGGYHLSKHDLDALREAIKDLQSILDTRSNQADGQE